MDTEILAKLSSLPIVNRAKRRQAKERKAVVRKRKSGSLSIDSEPIIASPVVSILISDNFPRCEHLTKRSRDMLNYDVGWTDDMVSAAHSIVTEGQEGLMLRPDSTANCLSLPVPVVPIETVENGKEVIELPSASNAECALEPVVRRSSSSKRCFKWTPEQDAHLKAAVAKVNAESERLGKWERIAEQMQLQMEIPLLTGFVFTGEMCRTRWSHYVGPIQQGLTRGGVWTTDEVEKLKQLVQQHTTAATEKKPAEIHWNVICDAEHMNRIPQECRNKWYELCDQHRNQGPFTAEENTLILRSVASWTHPKRKTGLWVSLGRDLDRPSKKIRDHWRCNLLPKEHNSATAAAGAAGAAGNDEVKESMVVSEESDVATGE